MNKYRTHTCSELSEKDIDENIFYQAGYIENEIMVIYYLLI